MTRFHKILGISLAVIAIVCIGFSIFQQGQNKLLLPAGLLCNCIAMLVYLFASKKHSK